MAISSILLLAASLTAETSSVAPPVEDRPVIWRELRAGMTPEQFAENLKKVEAVSNVEVIRKGKKPARVKITYANGSGIPTGNLILAVSPEFENNGLTSVSLAETNCYSTIAAKVESLLPVLGEKYPNQQTVQVVDSDGVPIGKQRAFYNDETRVTVSLGTIENPYPQHVYGGSGFLAAANKLANSMADSSYNAAIESCPDDRGKKATVTLTYVQQAAFMQQHATETAERTAKAKSAKEGL